MRAAVKELSKGADLHLMLIDSGHNIRVNIKVCCNQVLLTTSIDNFFLYQQQNVPEVKFSLDDNGIPIIQFDGCKTPIRVNIFDVVQVEVYEKDIKLKARLVRPE